jgi:PAS domain S-box-containing protein
MTKSVVRVLLIHGNEDDFFATKRLLAEFQTVRFELEWVDSYAEGLAAIHRRRHDVYLVDSRLDPKGAIRLIREATGAGTLEPILLFTLREDSSVEREATLAGASDCLVRAQTNSALLGRVMLHSLKYSALRAQLAAGALLATEEQFRLILDSAGEGIFAVDLHGRCTFCNPAAARALGYRGPEDLLGKNMHTLTHHTRVDGFPYLGEECRIDASFRTGVGVHVDDEIFWRADGTSFAADYFSHPIRKQGAVIGAVITFTDITERRRTQLALEKSEAHLRSLVEGASDGVVIVEDGVIRWRIRDSPESSE